MDEWVEKTTICVGTVQRPYCIQRFLLSVRASFPDIRIVVGDQDRRHPELDAFYRQIGVDVVYVEEDAGVGVARTAAVARCDTEFILFCDDDFLFSSETSLDHPLTILTEDPTIDIVGGVVRDILGPIDAKTSKVRRWEHFFIRDPKRRILMSAPIDCFTPLRREVRGIPYFLSDTVLNWKVARRSIFERGAGWDPQFKCNGEHSDFYFNVKENTDLGVAYCPSFVVYHHSPDDFSYRAKRDNPDGFRLLGEKWGVVEALDLHPDSPRMILARDWVEAPQAETADPAIPAFETVVPADERAPGPLDPSRWPASQAAPAPAPPDLRVLLPYGETLTVTDGGAVSLLVAIENRSDERIGCLGLFAPLLTYRVTGRRGAVGGAMRTPLCHDLIPGLTFHYVNLLIDWDAEHGEAFDVEIRVVSRDGSALGRGADAMIRVEAAARPQSAPPRERVIDFSKSGFPDFVLIAHGFSFVEPWGRWSDAQVAEVVTLRFVDALPRHLRLELTCSAYGPNAGQPVRVEIGGQTQSFVPVSSEAAYALDFELEGVERSIHIHPPAPASPASLDGAPDDRLLGLGFARLAIVSRGAEAAEDAGPAEDALFPHDRGDRAFWEQVYAREDPWNYSGDYEQEKYARTLELLPAGPIGSALEAGCAEGLFTEMLAPRVGRLTGIDISETSLERAKRRCAPFAQVSFACADISLGLPEGPFDLIVCSEILYYLQDEAALRTLAGRVVAALAPGGHVLMAHACSVTDDRTQTGFDFSEFGGAFIGSVFADEPALEFLKELRTPLYRIQLFQRRREPLPRNDDLAEAARQPREALTRPATLRHPLIRWGGCALTAAEARFFYETARVPILMYHRVAADGPDGLAPYRIDPERFERQLAYLQRHGYTTASTDEIWMSYAANARRPGKWIALTFDDAYQDFADVAWPLLLRYGMTATVFAPTAYVGGRADWDREYGEPAPLMDWDTMRRLQGEGVTFGSHSVSHRSLSGLPADQLAEELQRSRETMTSELGRAPQGFCFPYTDFDAAASEAVHDSGYAYALAGEVAAADVSACALPRIEIRGDMDLDAFVAALPPPLESPSERRDDFRRMRAARDRGTYFPYGSS